MRNILYIGFAITFLGSCGFGIGGNGTPYGGVHEDPPIEGFEVSARSDNYLLNIGYEIEGVHKAYLYKIENGVESLILQIAVRRNLVGGDRQYLTDGFLFTLKIENGSPLPGILEVHRDGLDISETFSTSQLVVFQCSAEAIAKLPFADGSGTLADPYKICTLNQLNSIRAPFLASHFVLMSNIDATESQTWNSGAGFLPIGFGETVFSGTFAGTDYSIDNLKYQNTGVSGVAIGLFHVIEGGEIRDLNLGNVNYRGRNSVGGLAGKFKGGILRRIFVSGIVHSNEHSSGAIVGSVEAGVIACSVQMSSLSASATVNSNLSRAGGLLGGVSCVGFLEKSWSSGHVSANQQAGGVVGTLPDLSFGFTVRESFATGNIEGRLDVGGLVGSSYSSTIMNSYSMANVRAIFDGPGSSTGEAVGGILGKAYNNARIENCYASGTVEGENRKTGGLVGSGVANIVDSYYVGTKVESIDKPAEVGAVLGLDGGADIDNAWWLAGAGVPTFCDQANTFLAPDCQSSATLSDFYNPTLTPLLMSWTENVWIFSANTLPKLIWE